MKKGFSLRVIIALFVMAALLLCAGLAVSADNPPAVVKSGFCGAEGNEENVTYTLYDDGTCVISGTGDMEDQRVSYNGFSYAPWVNDVPEEYTVTSVIIEEGVTGIGAYSFSYTREISQISIPSTVTHIGSYAFRDCKGLKNISIPSGVTEIPFAAFMGCTSLSGVDIPDTVTAIAGSAFEGCSSLKGIKLPSGLTEIGMAAFQNCTALERITIPQGVTSVGHKAFNNCANLAEIYIPDTVVTVGSEAFDNTAWIENRPGGPLYTGRVLYSAKFLTAADANLVIRPGTTAIMEDCFYRGNEEAKAIVTSISIPASVSALPQYVFSE
ncbi:MAG: leucine-rich repeat domain-containing protein, partial [Clostridia bacterium]|nr:leucine-rich repeat domain-containing protein [Clostridia bacterium]